MKTECFKKEKTSCALFYFDEQINQRTRKFQKQYNDKKKENEHIS